jgi:hypothetical protein
MYITRLPPLGDSVPESVSAPHICCDKQAEHLCLDDTQPESVCISIICQHPVTSADCFLVDLGTGLLQQPSSDFLGTMVACRQLCWRCWGTWDKRTILCGVQPISSEVLFWLPCAVLSPKTLPLLTKQVHGSRASPIYPLSVVCESGIVCTSYFSTPSTCTVWNSGTMGSSIPQFNQADMENIIHFPSWGMCNVTAAFPIRRTTLKGPGNYGSSFGVAVVAILIFLLDSSTSCLSHLQSKWCPPSISKMLQPVIMLLVNTS